jgi:hypothetical protein
MVTSGVGPDVTRGRLLDHVVISKYSWLVGWLVSDHSLPRGFGPYGIISINVCVVITVAMVMLLMDFGPCGLIFTYVCVVITVAMIMLLLDFGPYGLILTNVLL